jgi:hypothetical protein
MKNAKPLTVPDVLSAHAQFGALDRDSVKKGMGVNWPEHWDRLGPGQGIFAPDRARA